jgi:homocysteine S-methyltransferase
MDDGRTAPVPLAEAMMAGPPSSPVVLDGGLASQLTRAGHDLSDELWSARLLADDPDAIVAAHEAFFAAGADVATTASYQASVEGLRRRGFSAAQARGLLRRSVDLARQAIARVRDRGVERPLWIAASVGPYGAVLADGSEYRGNYGLSTAELVRFHRPRLELLAEAGPDVLALETVPDSREAEALLSALDGIGVPAWLSFTVANGRTRAGQPMREAFALAAGVDDVIAVGVNCSSPRDATGAVATAATASGKPVVVYPNSGEDWDADARRWTGPAVFTSTPLDAWLAGGARLVGGCCRVTPQHIAAIAAHLAAPPARP